MRDNVNEESLFRNAYTEGKKQGWYDGVEFVMEVLKIFHPDIANQVLELMKLNGNKWPNQVKEE